jgi:hypothetical protein
MVDERVIALAVSTFALWQNVVAKQTRAMNGKTV